MPMFYMMVGLPGSGKSFTAESIPNAVVHSSDAIRAEVLGDENDQTQQDLVFQTLHKRVLQDLVDGKDVVYDATNINYKRRIGFLDRVRALHKHDLRTVCLFMATPYEVCLERNNNRERSVPESVIQKMYFKFDVPMMAEGWDEIRIVGDEDRHDQIDTLMLRLSKLEHDNPHHEYTVGQHSMTAWQYLISHYKGADAALLRATLLHDIGKEKTKVFHDIKGNPTEIAHFYHHERVGAYDSFCYTGDLSPNQRLTVALLIRWHMWPYAVEKSDNPSKTVSKIKRLLGNDIWNQVMVLNACDREEITMIPDMIHTPYIAPRISVMAPPPVTAERFVDELLSGLCMPDGGFVAHLAPSGDPFSNGWNAAMKLQASQPTSRRLPMPVNVIFHNPATIVFWDDGDKTVVKCQPGDTFSAEAGLTAAMLKKYMGNDNTFNKVINEWLARASYASAPALPEATE